MNSMLPLGSTSMESGDSAVRPDSQCHRLLHLLSYIIHTLVCPTLDSSQKLLTISSLGSPRQAQIKVMNCRGYSFAIPLWRVKTKDIETATYPRGTKMRRQGKKADSYALLCKEASKG